MEFRFQDGTKLILDEGVDVAKFLANRGAPQAAEVKKIFDAHDYNLQVVPGSFLKIFTLDAKEIHELSLVLEEIDTLGLKEIFEANLNVQVFKRVFLERVKKCLDEGIPFVNSDHTFVRSLYNSNDFASFISTMPSQEKNVEAANLDEEDNMVKAEIIKELGMINESNDDPTLTFVISSIIANLDGVILSDNKAYRTMGVRHLIENALQGISLDPVMQSVVDTKILVNFPLEPNMERGI